MGETMGRIKEYRKRFDEKHPVLSGILWILFSAFVIWIIWVGLMVIASYLSGG